MANRPFDGGAELSHYGTEQQEQRTIIHHFRESRKSIGRVESSNQNKFSSVQCSRYPTEPEITQLEYMNGPEQPKGPRRQGQINYRSQKVVGLWEDGKPSPITPDTTVTTYDGFDQSFTVVCVDDCLHVSVQNSDDDTTAFVASTFLSSNHVRLFGPGEVGVAPIPTPQKRTDWHTTIEALGLTFSSHTMRMVVPRENIEARYRFCCSRNRPRCRREATTDCGTSRT